ncbi:MAG TPA: AsmA family protein [Candidatus Acidoferrales bacterium]|nr:AsmA family protein [Candidatus Acidoferrales bacterium]
MPSKKKPLVIAGIAIVVILLVLIVTPFFIDVNSFRPQIERALGQAIGRTVTIGNIRVSLLGGSLVANEIAISDDPRFGSQPFLMAKSFSVGVDVLPLLRSRDLIMHSLTFDGPQVQLLRSAKGDWNFASLGASTKAAGQTGAAGGPALNSFSVDSVKITNGTIAFGRAGEPARLAYESVNVTATNVAATSAFPFTFAAKTPGGGKLALEATVGPIGAGDANRMPFDGEMKADGVPATDVESLLAVLGYSLPEGSSLKGGTIQANLRLEGPLERMVTTGPVKLSNVTLAGYSLESKLASALGTAGTGSGNDTLIQLASSTLRYAPEGLRADAVNVVIPAIGSVTGAGTVSAANALHFRLVAKLAGTSGLAQLVNLPAFGANGGGLPFRVEGTTAHPKIVPEIGGLAKGVAGEAIQQLTNPQQGTSGGIGGLLGGLFGKKKKQPPPQPHP